MKTVTNLRQKNAINRNVHFTGVVTAFCDFSDHDLIAVHRHAVSRLGKFSGETVVRRRGYSLVWATDASGHVFATVFPSHTVDAQTIAERKKATENETDVCVSVDDCRQFASDELPTHNVYVMWPYGGMCTQW